MLDITREKRQEPTSVILPTTTSPTSPLNLQFKNMQPIYNYSKAVLDYQLKMVRVSIQYDLPGLKWSDTD